MTPLLAIAAKELRLLLRDPGGLLLLFLLPAAFILVLSLALQGAFQTIGTAERVPLLVVNEDTGDLGAELIEALKESDLFDPITEIDGQPVADLQARAAVAAQRFDAAVLIPAGASDAIDFERDATIEVLCDPALPGELAAAIEYALRDLVHGAIIGAQQVEGAARDTAIEELERRLRGLAAICPLPQSRPDAGLETAKDDSWPDYRCDLSLAHWPRHAVQHWGLQVRRVTAGHDAGATPNAVQQNVPGWTIFALFWIAQILALNLINERRSGIYRRMMVAPISFGTYIAGKALPFLLINLLQALVMFAIGVYLLPLFGCPQLAVVDPPLLLLITLAISCAAIGFGLLIATVARTPLMASAGSAAVLILMTALGGIMVPKFVMPQAMQRLTELVPHGWALEAYLDVLVRGAGWTEIWPQVAALASFAAVCCGLALARLRRRS